MVKYPHENNKSQSEQGGVYEQRHPKAPRQKGQGFLQ